jgi:hypothetical protein
MFSPCIQSFYGQMKRTCVAAAFYPMKPFHQNKINRLFSDFVWFCTTWTFAEVLRYFIAITRLQKDHVKLAWKKTYLGKIYYLSFEMSSFSMTTAGSYFWAHHHPCEASTEKLVVHMFWRERMNEPATPNTKFLPRYFLSIGLLGALHRSHSLR